MALQVMLFSLAVAAVCIAVAWWMHVRSPQRRLVASFGDWVLAAVYDADIDVLELELIVAAITAPGAPARARGAGAAGATAALQS